jgi:hypothetical protein
MKKILLNLLVFVSLNVNANTNSNEYWVEGNTWVKGNTLVELKVEYEKYSEDEKGSFSKALSYTNYIYGVLDSIEGISVCTPKNTNGGQIFAIVSKYINDNPDKWHYPAWNLVYEPLIKTFPCKK